MMQSRPDFVYKVTGQGTRCFYRGAAGFSEPSSTMRGQLGKWTACLVLCTLLVLQPKSEVDSKGMANINEKRLLLLRTGHTFHFDLKTYSQVEAAPLDNDFPKTAVRAKRMTPFWRTMSMRPVGASCRDDTECLTRLCRNQRCCLKTFED